MKQLIALHRIAFRPLALAAALFALAGVGYADDGIDPARRFSWSENSGWNNWRTSLESASVDLRFLSGFVWSENLGWIKLGTGNAPRWARAWLAIVCPPTASAPPSSPCCPAGRWN